MTLELELMCNYRKTPNNSSSGHLTNLERQNEEWSFAIEACLDLILKINLNIIFNFTNHFYTIVFEDSYTHWS